MMKPLHNKLKTCVVVMNEINGGFKKTPCAQQHAAQASFLPANFKPVF
jgi:hypothetical protein